MEKHLFTAVDETGREYIFDSVRQGNSVFLTLKKEQFRNAQNLYALGGFSAANAGDEGYYILPRSIQLKGELQTFFSPRSDTCFDVKLPIMTWYGIKKKNMCCIVRVERNYNLAFSGRVENNRYSAGPYFDFSIETGDAVYDDIRIEIVYLPLGSDYNAMAAAERNIRLSRGEIVTLAEKCRREPVEYARKYPLIRIRMGWKPSPSPLKQQTPENEPEMFAACTFERVRDIADALHKKGVEGAELQLVGWNKSGHDGRFPQLFPVDERLGGESELKKTIEHVQALGYRISLHTNTIDAYEIADSFTWDDIVANRDGQYRRGGDYSGGHAWHVCLNRQWKNTQRDLPQVAQFGLNGLHFTDVVSIVVPDRCYSKDHPCNLTDGIVYAQKIMEYASSLFGGFSSEGCMDFAMKYIDYGLYVTFGDSFQRTEPPICDRYLPVWELTYHGIVLYNPYSSTINYPIKEPAARNMFILHGGKPSFYIYSKFRTQGAANWMGEIDLTAQNEDALDKTVGIIAQSLDEYRSLADKQLLFMDRYDFPADGIECAVYSDGSRIAGNFTDKTVIFEGQTIEPWGYVVFPGKN